VVARFDGGQVTSDSGGLLLKEVEEQFRFVERFAGCFTDHRDHELIEHPLADLLKQIGPGPTDPNCSDRDELRLVLQKSRAEDERGFSAAA
jgi:hypothetical protein